MPRWSTLSRPPDWIVWQLTGTYVRNACTAGYKGMYQDGAYPDEAFLSALNPGFASFVSDKLEHTIGQLGDRAGALSAQAAAWTGLPEGIAVAVGNVGRPRDRSGGAGGRARPDGGHHGYLDLPMSMNAASCTKCQGCAGSSTEGSSQACGGMKPARAGSATSSAGSSSTTSPRSITNGPPPPASLCTSCSPSCPADRPSASTVWSRLDWHSGNRSVLVDHELSGLVVGQTLATRAEDTYRALLEATAFGTRTIIEAFTSSGVPVTELVVAGGLLKNTLLMQIYADVTNLPLSTIAVAQGPALGSAIHAAVAAGAYPDVHAAAAAMGRSDKAVYQPIAANVKPTTSSSPTTPSCTTTSGAEPMLSCIG